MDNLGSRVFAASVGALFQTFIGLFLRKQVDLAHLDLWSFCFVWLGQSHSWKLALVGVTLHPLLNRLKECLNPGTGVGGNPPVYTIYLHSCKYHGREKGERQRY